MKRIHILGAGPAGLYFALLMRRKRSDIDIEIWERDSIDASHGWGIVLTSGTLDVLRKHDAATHAGIAAHAQEWSELEIHHLGRSVRLRGFPYGSMARIELLSVLRNACADAGVRVNYEQPVDDLDALGDCDLLVGADGANSLVRRTFADEFKPRVDVRNNRFIWLGTTRVFDAFTMMFRKYRGHVFAAEGYRYSDSMSTFIAQCTDETWRATGLADMSVDDSLAVVREIFAAELDGHAVQANPSSDWRQFPYVRNQQWAVGNKLLLGDALHTAHFSIGSGTRLALEDAIAAARHLADAEDTLAALQQFESERRPAVERFQQTALNSLRWYEQLDDVIDLDLIPFAYSAMTRSNAVDLRILKLQDPAFARRYQEWRDQHGTVS